MERIRVVIVLVLLLTSGWIEVRAQKNEPVTLRVLTYNIYHGETTDGRIDMELFASIINEVKPDLVALQEVDKNARRTGVIDIAKELGSRTELEHYFVKHRDFQGGEYGNAILSRFPVTRMHVIEGYKSTENGITIPSATVQLDNGEEIVFNCTHLSTRREDRRAQARQLLDFYIDTLNRAPMIIAGDLNAEPQHEEIQWFFEEFVDADTTYANTFSTRTTLTKKIDYILYPRNTQWEVLETQVLCRGDASDHCAFFAVLKYTP